MATTRGDAGASTEAPTTAAKKPEAAKLGEDFQPNEPKPKSGVDKDGNPDDSLSEKQMERAASEALLSLRPQPSADEIGKVLAALTEWDPQTGQPKVKCKTAAEAGTKAVEELNRQRTAG